MPSYILENLFNDFVQNGDDFPKVILNTTGNNNIVSISDNNYTTYGKTGQANFFMDLLKIEYPNNTISGFNNLNSIHLSYSNKAALNVVYVNLLNNIYINPNQNSNIWFVGPKEINTSTSFLNGNVYLSECAVIGSILHWCVPYNNYFFQMNNNQISYSTGAASWALNTTYNNFGYATSNAGAFFTLTPSYTWRYLILFFMSYNNTSGAYEFDLLINNEKVGNYKNIISTVSSNALSVENYIFLDMESEDTREIRVNRLAGQIIITGISAYTNYIANNFSKNTLVLKPQKPSNYISSANVNCYNFEDRLTYIQKSACRFLRDINLNVSFIDQNYSISGKFYDTTNRFWSKDQAESIYEDFKSRGLKK